MAQKTMIEAITEALAIELRNDDRTLIFGEDVGLNGGIPCHSRFTSRIW